MIKKALSLLGVIMAIAIIAGGVIYRQQLQDLYVAKTVTQQDAATKLKDELQLTGKGSLMYLASQPQVQASEDFNRSCQGALHSHSIVLGCYSRKRIYIYDVKDERLNGVKEVTAAHELLHAAYERLSLSEKNELSEQLKLVAENIKDSRLQQSIDEYHSSGETVLVNELHSILGTELAVLPDKLEKHYSQYFTDRQRIVGLAKQYAETFDSLKKQIEVYDVQLESLMNEKNSLESLIKTTQAEIEGEQSRLNQLQQSGQIQAYNSAVPAYNNKIRAYNQAVANLRSVIEQYNGVVEKRNNLAAAQNDLVQQLDSDYETL